MDEPSWVLRGVTYHFASGQAWWMGLLLVLWAVRAEEWGWSSGKVLLLTLLGLVWLALSGWPFYVMQTLVVAAIIVWLIRRALPARVPNVAHLRQAVMVLVVGAILLELPWLLGRRDTTPAIQELAVIGDSVTAGLNARDVTWPQVLAQSGVCMIWDASQQGATVQSATQQLSRLDGRGDALLIEIGGNDLLEGLPVDVFTNQLFKLLLEAKTDYSTVVMLELPLPPLSNRYGMAQRRLARLFGIPLIPKREFARVLTTSGSTVDGIHLSDRGQQQMADVIRYWMRLPERSSTPVEYHRVDVR